MVIGDKRRSLRFDHGPISFGNLVGGEIVSWSDGGHDLLLSRCWRGVYLYPSEDLSDRDFAREPTEVCDDLEYLTRAIAFDSNGDGIDELLLTDRPGFLYTTERRGVYPDISFHSAEALRDDSNGLLFNIPFENPYHPGPDNQGGYLDSDFFCYVYPVVYSMDGDPGRHLILGDGAGNLWWMRDESSGDGIAKYSGVEYRKSGEPMSYGVRYRERYGTTFSKPRHKLGDQSGEPFLIGKAFEGYRNERGGNSKPIAFPSDRGDSDLLVLATSQFAEIRYLARSGINDDGVPVFEDTGAIELLGIDRRAITFHSPIMISPDESATTMLLATTAGLAVLNRMKAAADAPLTYRFSRLVSGSDVPAAFYGFTEIIQTENDGRYVLDNPGSFRLFPIRGVAETLRIGSDYSEIEDQDGVYRPEGVTDVRTAPNWGVHRAVRWKYDTDRRTRTDLVVGTDPGHLYLLRAGETNDSSDYHRYGPLEDRNGQVIKIHDRVFPAPFDYWRRGFEDLLLVGANYQMGIALDPNAGSGFYVCRLDGVRDDLPILDPPVPITFVGFEPSLEMNQNPHLQAVDIDGDGEIELVVAVKNDAHKGRIFRVAPEGGALIYTGGFVSEFRLHQRFLDIDGDGEIEHVFAGGETGIGWYKPIVIEREE